VPGGRLSPSVSEADLNHPADTARNDVIHAVSKTVYIVEL